MRGASSAAVSNTERSLLSVAALLLRNRRWIISAGVLGCGVALAIAFLRPKLYRSSVSFLPQNSLATSATPSPLAALGGSLGIALGSNNLGNSPEFYVDLIRSRPVLEHVARDTFSANGFKGTLMDYIGARGPEPARLERAVRWLDETVIWTGTRRGIVHLYATTRSATLSQQIADRTIQHLGEFNVDKRQSRAAADRQFTGERLAVAQEELARAERQMQDFLIHNRAYQSSPALTFTHDRLQGAISLRLQVLATLLQQHEQARIEEVRNTPVISVLDPANLPPTSEPRHALFALIAGSLTGAVVAIAAAFLAAPAREQPEIVAADDWAVEWREARLNSEVSAPTTKLTKLS